MRKSGRPAARASSSIASAATTCAATSSPTPPHDGKNKKKEGGAAEGLRSEGGGGGRAGAQGRQGLVPRRGKGAAIVHSPPPPQGRGPAPQGPRLQRAAKGRGDPLPPQGGPQRKR